MAYVYQLNCYQTDQNGAEVPCDPEYIFSTCDLEGMIPADRWIKQNDRGTIKSVRVMGCLYRS